MKPNQFCLLLTALSVSVPLLAAEPASTPVTSATPALAAVSNPASTNAIAGPEGPNSIRLNFRNAPLNLVLEHLSDAAGFIINKEGADIKGTVDVWSKDPVTRDEAVELLNSVLKKSGCAVIRNGRILTIVNMENAKTADTEVVSVSNPENMEASDEVVTSLIPVRYANATQLMNNLQVLLPMSTSLSVNESANTLVLVATKRDVRRILKIVHALDSSIASVTSIKVIQLKHADAKQLATEIQALFSPQPTTQGGPGGFRGQLANLFRGGGGPGGFGGGGTPGGNAGAGGSGGGTGGVNAKVTATSDDYSNALIISAPADLMVTITEMVDQIDVPTTDVTELRVFKLRYADPVELAEQFALLFADQTAANNNVPNFGFRFGGGRGNPQATTSDRTKKKSQVVAVAEPRTSSLLVTAASELMPHITNMIAQLDVPARHEVVSVIDLKNADPQDVSQVLDDLFHRTGQVRTTTANSRSMLGTGNPLTQRSTQQQPTTSTSSGFGNNPSGGNRGTGAGF
jgi:type II secretory pathway component GspD/PulD (secretin)